MQHRRIITALIVTLFIHAGSAAAQSIPRWWLGAFGGISFSLLEGEIHALDPAHPAVATPDGFTGGNDVGPLGGVIFEYQAAEYWGGALAVVYDDPHRIVLGRIAAEVAAPVLPDRRYVVIGWRAGEEGRTRFAGTAIFNDGGDLVGRAVSTWFDI